MRIPLAPIINTRTKVTADEYKGAKDLINYMEQLNYMNTENANYEKDKLLLDTIRFPYDKHFIWRPQSVAFMVKNCF